MVQKKKSSEKLRPVINLKPLNQFLVKKSFKVDHLGVVMKLVRKGNWSLSIDLTDAYFHVPILLNHRMFLKFAVGHHCYQFRCLHFGPTTAPRVFTKMLSAVLQFLREQGVQITAYLDDSLLFQNHPDYLCNSRDTALQVLNRLGFLVNLVKSELPPSQSVKFIGVQFQLNRGIVSGTQEWFAKIKALIHSSSAQNQTSALMLLRILGINNGINNSGYEVGSFTHETNSIAPVVLLESQVKRHQGVDTSEHCPAMLFSIMVVTGRECFGGSSIVTGTSRSVRGRGRGGDLKGRSILIRSDNMSVVTYINKQGCGEWGDTFSSPLHESVAIIYGSWTVELQDHGYTCCRGSESESRSPVQIQDPGNGMDVESISGQSNFPLSGKTTNRSVCIRSTSCSPNFLLLAAEPEGVSDRCI